MRNKISFCFPLLTSTFMQIDSLTMFADKMQTTSRTYIMSNSLSYYPPFFYTILLFLLFTFVSSRSFYTHSLLFVSHWTSCWNQSSSHWTPSKKASRFIRQFSTLKKLFSDLPKKRIEEYSIHATFHRKYEYPIDSCTKYQTSLDNYIYWSIYGS